MCKKETICTVERTQRWKYRTRPGGRNGNVLKDLRIDHILGVSSAVLFQEHGDIGDDACPGQSDIQWAVCEHRSAKVKFPDAPATGCTP